MSGRLIAATVVLLILIGNMVFAANGKAPDTAKKRNNVERISLDRAREIALESYPGTILEAEKEHDLYEIKIRMENGEVLKVKIDPVDGSMVSFKKKTQKK